MSLAVAVRGCSVYGALELTSITDLTLGKPEFSSQTVLRHLA